MLLFFDTGLPNSTPFAENDRSAALREGMTGYTVKGQRYAFESSELRGISDGHDRMDVETASLRSEKVDNRTFVKMEASGCDVELTEKKVVGGGCGRAEFDEVIWYGFPGAVKKAVFSTCI